MHPCRPLLSRVQFLALCSCCARPESTHARRPRRFGHTRRAAPHHAPPRVHLSSCACQPCAVSVQRMRIPAHGLVAATSNRALRARRRHPLFNHMRAWPRGGDTPPRTESPTRNTQCGIGAATSPHALRAQCETQQCGAGAATSHRALRVQRKTKKDNKTA